MSTGQRIAGAIADTMTEVVFRTVEVRRRDGQPEGAELILASHAGGLADILLVIRASTRFPRFLARDLIWKVPLGARVMRAVGGIPVHRREDHGGAANNDGMFDDAFAALANGDVAAIYPEGESVPEPRLAPLRTGAARIALGALARGTDVTISPMGLHFFDVSVLRARGMADCAVPFKISDVVAELGVPGPVSESNQELVHAVTAVFQQRLGEVSDHYDDWEQRRRMELAATTYLQDRRPDELIAYSSIASAAGRLARAPEEHRQEVDTAAHAYLAELELLGIGPEDVPRAAMVSARLAGEAATVALLAPVAAYGLAVNAVGILGLRLISLTGMAAPTAATVKPAYAVLAFPASWAALGWAGYRRGGPLLAALLAISGPVSLGATVRAGERGQLLFRVGRALRRAKGPLIDQVVAARQAVVDAVEATLESNQVL